MKKSRRGIDEDDSNEGSAVIAPAPPRSRRNDSNNNTSNTSAAQGGVENRPSTRSQVTSSTIDSSIRSGMPLAPTHAEQRGHEPNRPGAVAARNVSNPSQVPSSNDRSQSKLDEDVKQRLALAAPAAAVAASLPPTKSDEARKTNPSQSIPKREAAYPSQTHSSSKTSVGTIASNGTSNLASIPTTLHRTPETRSDDIPPPPPPPPPPELSAVGAFAYTDSSRPPDRRSRDLGTVDAASMYTTTPSVYGQSGSNILPINDRQMPSSLLAEGAAGEADNGEVKPDEHENGAMTPAIVSARVVDEREHDTTELEDQLRAQFKRDTERIKEELRATMLANVAVGEVVPTEAGRSVADNTEAATETAPTEENKSSRRCLWISMVVVVVCLAIGIGAGIALSGSNSKGGDDADSNRAIDNITPTLSPIASVQVEEVMAIEYGIIIPNGRNNPVSPSAYTPDLIGSMDRLASEILLVMSQPSTELSDGNRRRLELSLDLPTKIVAVRPAECPGSIGADLEADVCENISASMTLRGIETEFVAVSIFEDGMVAAINTGRLQVELESINPDSPVAITGLLKLNTAPTIAPTVAPTMDETPPSDSELNRMRDLLFPISGSTLNDTRSLQFDALYWMAMEDPGKKPVDMYEVEELRQRYVAVLFYLTLGGQDWNNHFGFLEATHICDWNIYDTNRDYLDGISCNDGDSVTYISLSFNGLAGSIPVEVEHFTDIAELDLSFNGIEGTIPTELGNLQKLKILYLPQNRLTGEIPPAVAALPELLTLTLYQNYLSGPIPSFANNRGVIRLIDLEYNYADSPLYGSLNDILDGIPPTNFQEFCCSGCQLDGSIPGDKLALFTNLQILALESSGLVGAIPDEIGRLSSLTTLLLSFNRLTGPIPESLGTIPSLETMFVGANNLSGTVPSFRMNSGSLYQLYLQYDFDYDDEDNHLFFDVEDFFVNTPGESLHTVGCDGCALSGSLPSTINAFTSLVMMQLNNNQDGPGIIGTLPTEIGELVSLNSVRLDHNSLHGAIPTEIGLIPLQSLSAVSNGLSGQIPSQIASIESLVIIELWDNDLTGPLPIFFGNAEFLQIINLSGNHGITGDIAVFFDNGPTDSLVSFQCYDCDLHGSLPPSIGEFTWLQYLVLPHNRLSGELPTTLGSLQFLESLELEENLLEGNIPSEVGGMPLLSTIWLHGNGLTGTIPQSIANMPWLRDLRLGNNGLTGQLPSFSLNQGALETIIVEYNIDLWGSINSFFTSAPSNNFRSFYSTGCALRGSIPSEIGRFTKLEDLSIAEAIISGSIPEQIGGLTMLELISLHTNRMTGLLPDTLGDLMNVQSLQLGDNLFTGTIPIGIGELPHLEDFGIGSTGIGGPMPSFEKNLGALQSIDANFAGGVTFDLDQFFSSAPTSLRELECAECLVDGTLPTTIGRFINLIALQIAGAGITGPIPSEIGLLASLQSVAFPDNGLTGTIPAEIGQIPHLTGAHLRHNQLSGPIPPFGGNDFALSVVELGWNLNITQPLAEFFDTFRTPTSLTEFECIECNLEGTIPDSITQYTFLEVLAVPKSQLFGPIPSSMENLTSLVVLAIEQNDLTGTVAPSLCANMEAEDFTADCGAPFEVICECCTGCWSDETNSFI